MLLENFRYSICPVKKNSLKLIYLLPEKNSHYSSSLPDTWCRCVLTVLGSCRKPRAVKAFDELARIFIFLNLLPGFQYKSFMFTAILR